MDDIYSRTVALIGEENLDILQKARVAVFGVGGVGGYVIETLGRAGVGSLDIVDNDIVSLSNINRQIIALHSSVGKKKIAVMKERLLDINPSLAVTTWDCFFLPETAAQFDFTHYDYIVDAVDTVTAKIELAVKATQAGRPLISCMGAGNKRDPSLFKVADIYATSGCPLARVMRHELKKRHIPALKVVYSTEPVVCSSNSAGTACQRPVPSSISFVPAAAGLLVAAEVINDLLCAKN